MSRLQVFDEADARAPLLDTADGDEIATVLGGIGVRFERWPLRPLNSADDILTVYADEVARLTEEGGYRSIDVAAIAPDHPERDALRGKFLSEHTHGEDEVRFFVDGEGLFTLHHDGRVFNMLCTAGDLISVPAGMRHWFDMGAAPRFTAIRLFVNPDGWIARFTGDAIADHFPRHEPPVTVGAA